MVATRRSRVSSSPFAASMRALVLSSLLLPACTSGPGFSPSGTSSNARGHGGGVGTAIPDASALDATPDTDAAAMPGADADAGVSADASVITDAAGDPDGSNGSDAAL